MVLSNKTFVPNKKYENRKWFIIDCSNKKLGRLATSIVSLLKGKINTNYYSSVDIGHYIILVNAKLILTKKKKKQFLVNQPGRPGRSLKIKKNENLSPKTIIKRAIKKMLPRTETKKLIKRLYIYSNSIHKHKSQNPININL